MLYRLVEVGHLTRLALHAPLGGRGLEPGDDALMFLLGERTEATEGDLAAALETDPAGLRRRIGRLCDAGFVARHAAGADLPSRLALTQSGEETRKALARHWDRVEDALLGGLGRKERKRLRRTLGRLADMLRS